MDFFLRVEYADISLLGGREENQDRVAVAGAEKAALLLVVDGMGGHAHGARAAQVTQQVIVDAFWHTPQPLFDPLGFLHLTLGRAHEAVVKLGVQLPLEQRPRATCALCLIQQRASWWAHVGDSRLYHVRHGALLARSRDHSHVELLLREGLISAEQAQTHPMRNFVECCLGGDPILPDMSLTRCRRSCAARARAGSPPSTACCRAPRIRARRARRPAASRAGAPRRSSASSAARCARSWT